MTTKVDWSRYVFLSVAVLLLVLLLGGINVKVIQNSPGMQLYQGGDRLEVTLPGVDVGLLATKEPTE